MIVFRFGRLLLVLGFITLLVNFIEPLLSQAQAPEVIERRTATSKHYQLGPHLYEAKISAYPLHYQDLNGVWRDIDLQPQPQSTGTFAVMASPFKVLFPPQLEAGLGLIATVTLPPLASTPLPDEPLPLIEGKPDLSQIARRHLRLDSATPQPQVLPLKWSPRPFEWYQQDKWVATLDNSFETHGLTQLVSYESDLMRQQFYPLVDGLRHVVVLDAMPQQAIATAFVQNIKITKPKPLHLEGLTLFNATSQAVFDFTLPQVIDAQGQTLTPLYKIKTIKNDIELQITIPVTWLMTAAYPVQIENGLRTRTTTSGGFQQAGQLSQCNSTRGLATEDIMRVGNRSEGDCVAGSQRAVVQWDINALPITAMIAFPSNSRPVNSQLWHLPISSTGGGVLSITTHRLLAPWDGNFTTWQTRTLTQSWATSGGDYFASPEDTANVVVQGSPQYVNMGSLYNAVSLWRTNYLLFDKITGFCSTRDICHGEPNYGVLYQSGQEANPISLDRAFARGLNPNTAPMLTVTYFDADSLIPLENNGVFTIPRAPSPDRFLLPAANYSNVWTALAIQPREVTFRTDYDLVLSDMNNSTLLEVLKSSNVKISQQRGIKTDFIAISPGIDFNLSAWAIPFEGTGPYYLKYLVNTPRLNLDDSQTVKISSTSLMEMYELNLTAGVRYQLELQHRTGNADLSMVLFPPGVSQAFAIKNALLVVDAKSFGETERAIFVANQTGIYGLAVLNNGLKSGTTSEFNLKLQKFVTQIYLPTVLKQVPPPPPPLILPDNGNFEANMTSWAKTEPGYPLLVSVAANPDTACFGGANTALIGSPTTETNLLVNIPVNQKATLSQSFKVPDNATQLRFKYKVFSYDIVQNSKGIYDYFGVNIDKAEQTPPGKVGNPAISLSQQTVLKGWSSGCQSGSIDLQAYKGQTIKLEFFVYNGVYDDRNTWAYVDDVQVLTE